MLGRKGPPPHFGVGGKLGKYAKSSHRSALQRVRKLREKYPFLPPQPELTKEQKLACLEFRFEAHIRTELMGERYDVDHITPIRAGGLEVPENLQVLSREVHYRKTSGHIY